MQVNAGAAVKGIELSRIFQKPVWSKIPFPVQYRGNRRPTINTCGSTLPCPIDCSLSVASPLVLVPISDLTLLLHAIDASDPKAADPLLPLDFRKSVKVLPGKRPTFSGPLKNSFLCRRRGNESDISRVIEG